MAKTKIELFEENLILEGLSDEKLQEFEKLLKRAGNDWNRIQHCFITAAHFPVSRLDDAVKLIEFGIDRYKSSKNGLSEGIQEIEVIGVDGGGCVSLTALGAIDNGYKVTLNTTCIGTVFKKQRDKYYKKLREKGATII